MEMEDTTKTTLTNVAGQPAHALNNTASQFAERSTTIESSGLPIAVRKYYKEFFNHFILYHIYELKSNEENGLQKYVER